MIFFSRSISCTACGEETRLYNPRSLVLVCPACRSVMDLLDEEHRIIGSFSSHFHKMPVMPGWEGKFDHERVTVTGRLRYTRSSDRWDEYYILSCGGRNLMLRVFEGRPEFYEAFFTMERRPPPETGNSILLDQKEQEIVSSGYGRIVQADGELPWRAVKDDIIGWIETKNYSVRFRGGKTRHYQKLSSDWIYIKNIFGRLGDTPYTAFVRN